MEALRAQKLPCAIRGARHAYGCSNVSMVALPPFQIVGFHSGWILSYLGLFYKSWAGLLRSYLTTMEARYQLLKADAARESDQILKSGVDVVSRARRLALALAFVISVVILSFIYVRHGSAVHFPSESNKPTFYNDAIQQCPSGVPAPASPPAPVNLWAPLDLEDAVQIRRWLEAPDRGLNLTRVDTRYSSSDNMLYNLETYYPSKAEALAYLAEVEALVESPSSIPPPDRYARVTIHHGARLEPVVKDYLVGPLPVGTWTEMRELKNIYHRDDIPFHARGFAVNSELQKFLGRMMIPFAEATMVSLALISFHSTQ